MPHAPSDKQEGARLAPTAGDEMPNLQQLRIGRKPPHPHIGHQECGMVVRSVQGLGAAVKA
jgi:hypothetical protein